jgi:nucleotide-binding universal stress UspA family protein
MYQRLLVPLDGTPTAAVALPPARTLAKAFGAELRLLHVTTAESATADSKTLTKIQNYLARIAQELTQAGLRVRTTVSQGDPADRIVREAGAMRADLIVMATHGRGGLQRVVLGSVAQGVLAHSGVPVMLLRPGGRRMNHVKTILVPVDGTPGASSALRLAAPLVRATGASIELVHVVPPGAEYYVEGGKLIEVGSEEAVRAAAQHYVEGMARRLDRAALKANGRALVGHPAQEIVKTADSVGADLILMSTHGLTGPARTVLGSVADEVLRQADVPVLLMRQHQEAADLAPADTTHHTVFVV